MPGLTGQDDVSVENAHMVRDVETIFNRAFDQNRYLREEIVQMKARHDVEMAQMCVDMCQAQQDVRQALAGSSSGPRGTKFDLVDVKSMSPSVCNASKRNHFKAWSTKFKGYFNAKVNWYREALEASEKCKTKVDAHTIQTWS